MQDLAVATGEAATVDAKPHRRLRADLPTSCMRSRLAPPTAANRGVTSVVVGCLRHDQRPTLVGRQCPARHQPLRMRVSGDPPTAGNAAALVCRHDRGCPTSATGRAAPALWMVAAAMPAVPGVRRRRADDCVRFSASDRRTATGRFTAVEDLRP